MQILVKGNCRGGSERFQRRKSKEYHDQLKKQQNDATVAFSVTRDLPGFQLYEDESEWPIYLVYCCLTLMCLDLNFTLV